jgi:hypothetical protein
MHVMHRQLLWPLQPLNGAINITALPSHTTPRIHNCHGLPINPSARTLTGSVDVVLYWRLQPSTITNHELGDSHHHTRCVVIHRRSTCCPWMTYNCVTSFSRCSGGKPVYMHRQCTWHSRRRFIVCVVYREQWLQVDE